MTAPRERDEQWMRRCLELAVRAEGRTAPNPMVGAVVVDRRGRLVGEGWHRRAGAMHAEVEALEAAGARARGGTLYVNLEPCIHQGRTPPCAPRVAAAGVARVVIGGMDPIRGHGGGARWLTRRGIEVSRGVLGPECAEANRAWLMWARVGRPWFTLKVAASLDGKIATWRGESKWLTGPVARRAGHRLRDRHDAILVGVGTALADDPQLNVRGVRGGRDPMRIVVDSSLRLPAGAALLASGRGQRRPARVAVATLEGASPFRARRLELAGAEIWRFPARGGRVDLAALARRLAAEGVTSVLVEGGPTLHGTLLDAGLLDELRLFVAPLVVGGAGRRAGRSWAASAGIDRLDQARRFEVFGEPQRLGDDVSLILRPVAHEPTSRAQLSRA